MYLLIVQVYAALVIVDGKAAVLRLAGGRIRRAVAYVAQGYAYAGQKLRRAEGLCNVVVRAQIQCLNLVPLAVAGGKHDYRHLRPLADVFDYVHAVHIGQAEIQQHHVGAVRGYR